MDNIMFYPIRIWVMSRTAAHTPPRAGGKGEVDEQVHDEIIGARSVEEDVFRKVEAEFEEKKPERRARRRRRGLLPMGQAQARYYTNDEGDFVPNRAMRF